MLGTAVGYLAAGLLGAGVTGYALRRRGESPTVDAFACFAPVAPVVSLSLTGQTLATTLPGKLARILLSYAG